MSRAFVKEPDGDDAGEDTPERPRSEHPNYITVQGLAVLHARQQALAEARSRLQGEDESLQTKNQIQQIDRDLRYVEQSIQRAIPIDPARQPSEDIRFGAEVELLDENGERHRITIVGEDEMDLPRGLISWVSPLARALLGKRTGDVVVWERPAGNLEVEILSFTYPRPQV